ncbi:inositol polyphosphate-5-phosphatase A isoform X9 [Delphinapterus leucas]|uniref:inositol-polyphosphate 5-phosphatase n=1 Tax=Delphinapterus leucas TaxID=9749 RepID=A0A2Y9N4D2_DELLE|nr:inositol polyphosphate-5-phosphatase A isoform X9 [Delphinapterus leucas]
MAGKAAAPGTAVLLVTANVGSLFDDPENLQKNWLREFYQVVHTHRPHFLALHCQEFGGKNYEASMSHVDKFVRELLSGDAMKEYNRARVYLDENYESQEHFTALGSFYFLHESLKNISQFDFKAKKYKKVTGKEIYSDTLESTPMLEKEKFPQDYFPECKWSRKGFIRTRWCLADCAFDLVNIHLFHDASNLVAWETSPSVYSGIRHKALGYVLDRIIDQRFEKASYFVFGDFNFRLDSKSVVENKCHKKGSGSGRRQNCHGTCGACGAPVSMGGAEQGAWPAAGRLLQSRDFLFLLSEKREDTALGVSGREGGVSGAGPTTHGRDTCGCR